MSPEQLQNRLHHPLEVGDFSHLGKPYRGKVRDCYVGAHRRLLIASDRVSAFDVVLGHIPFKGQVLTSLSNWWFEKTQDIVPNHLVSCPHPNAVVVKEAQPLPLEIVVRGYLTGSSKTALWTLYEAGDTSQYGLKLPPGLSKNTALPEPVITPTTKGAKDVPLSAEQIVSQGLLTESLWLQLSELALKLFQRGGEVASKAGLVLVDTKYEFGLLDGQLILIDEIHTPDSSRFWLRGTEHQAEPVHMDKELLRLWLVEQNYRGQGSPPQIPESFALQLAETYLKTHSMLTGTELDPPKQSLQQALQGVEL